MTSTHEIGHWLGLYHIFEGGCDDGDEVDDTPAQEKYWDCPEDGEGTKTCGSFDMYMNFMSYTGSGCRNMFTVGQVERAHFFLSPGQARQGFVDYHLNPTTTRFVNFIYVITGNIGRVQCEFNHVFTFLAAHVNLCVSHSNNKHIHGISDIYLADSGETSCDSEDEGIDLLDTGFHLCYHKESLADIATIITDIRTFRFDSAQSDPDHEGYTLILTDVGNRDIDYIYLGYQEVTEFTV